MERPFKRQKLSQEQALAIPSRTIDLNNLQRPQNRRRNGGKVLLPRFPDVTVTAAVLEVAVIGGSTATEIAVPTVDVALTLGDMGTLTVPSASSTSDPTNTVSGLMDDVSSLLSASTSSNGTFSSTTGESTVTVTATSTFYVSYSNGTFIASNTRSKTRPTDSSTEDGSDSSSSKYYFNLGTSDASTVQATSGASGSYNSGVVAGATDTSPGAQPTNSSTSDPGTSPPVLSPQQTKMVGGIVGGLAGMAMILIAILYVFRWYRARLKKQGRLPKQLMSSHNSGDYGVAGLVGCAAPMSQNNGSFFSGIPSSTKKWRPGSDMTTLTNVTTTTVNESEKGFQRVSGRKIPSVLTTGGDQFGGSYGAFEKESGALIRTTPNHQYGFDADSVHGHTPPHRPASRSAPTTPVYPLVFAGEVNDVRRPSLSSPRSRGFDDLPGAFGRNMSKPDGVAVFHSSPARTPVMQSPNTFTLRLPSQAPVSMDSDIPEMPLPSPGYMGANYGIGIAIGTGAGERRIPSGRLSARSGTSIGRFKEEID